MGKRNLTDAELKAYRELARAAKKLQEAQRAAELQRENKLAAAKSEGTR
jgi:hypothetical protein